MNDKSPHRNLSFIEPEITNPKNMFQSHNNTIIIAMGIDDSAMINKSVKTQ